jgi:hypothetical protein
MITINNRRFNIADREGIENGSISVFTRNGEDMRIVCWDRKADTNIIAVPIKDGYEKKPICFNNLGMCCGHDVAFVMCKEHVAMFDNGQCVIDGKGDIRIIKDFVTTEDGESIYVTYNQKGHIVEESESYIESNYTKWTIDKAKKGDILACNLKIEKWLVVFNGMDDYKGGYIKVAAAMTPSDGYTDVYDSLIDSNGRGIHPANDKEVKTMMDSLKDMGYTIENGDVVEVFNPKHIIETMSADEILQLYNTISEMGIHKGCTYICSNDVSEEVGTFSLGYEYQCYEDGFLVDDDAAKIPITIADAIKYFEEA